MAYRLRAHATERRIVVNAVEERHGPNNAMLIATIHHRHTLWASVLRDTGDTNHVCAPARSRMGGCAMRVDRKSHFLHGVFAVLPALTIGLLTETHPAHALPASPPAFGSAVFGQIDATGCQSPEGSFNFLDGGNCFSSLSQSSSVSRALNDAGTGSFASAKANLAAGSVSVTVSGVTGPTPGSAGAHALIWDTLVFSGARPGATVTLTMSGTTTLAGDARVGATAVLLEGTNLPYALLEGNDFFFLQGAGADPVTPTYSFQETFGIVNDTPMILGIDVMAFAGVSGCDALCPPPGSASITDPFHLDVPEGVTYTSASKRPSSVPEPATVALFAGGMTAGAVRRFGRRMVPA